MQIDQANKVGIVFFDLDPGPVAKSRDFNRLPGLVTAVLLKESLANPPRATIGVS